MRKIDEERLTNKVLALVEKQIDEGTAPPSTISHFLRLATAREQLELKWLEEKTNHIKKEGDDSEDFKKVMEALRSYRGE